MKISLLGSRLRVDSGSCGGITVEDRMFLGMQDFDFCSNLIKFYQIYPKFYPIYPNLPKFAHILPKLA